MPRSLVLLCVLAAGAGCTSPSRQEQGGDLFGGGDSLPAPWPETATLVVTGLYLPSDRPLGPFGARLSELPTRRCQAGCYSSCYTIQTAGSSTAFELWVWAWKVEDGEAVHVLVQVLGENGAWAWEGECRMHKERLGLPMPVKIALPNEEAAHFIFLAGMVSGMGPEE
ncbi:MAG: hypothetical protein AMS14_02495 [Planctomycetes bacterium DG_20]|nr:MAG: hypothetical protein AMS14_02495 [Planctomycetes bacterium DG_20]